MTTIEKTFDLWSNRASATYQCIGQPFGSSQTYSEFENRPVMANLQPYQIDEPDSVTTYIRYNDNSDEELIIKITES